MRKTPLIVGFVFGILIVPIGAFVGLQISPVLANVLLFPFIAVSALTGTPLGDMSTVLWIGLTVLSGCIWAAAFTGIGRLTRK